MVKQGGYFNSIPMWSKYPIVLDWILLWLIPLILAIFSFGWFGLIYLPVVFIAVAKISPIFLAKQLRKRLVGQQQSLDNALKSDDEIKIDIERHRVNELKWLISHPKSAQHLALSEKNKAHPKIAVEFEHQVSVLDNLEKHKSKEDL